MLCKKLYLYQNADADANANADPMSRCWCRDFQMAISRGSIPLILKENNYAYLCSNYFHQRRI